MMKRCDSALNAFMLATGLVWLTSFCDATGLSDEDEAHRISAMEKIADLALVLPKLNTSPLPGYGYHKLDYGMTIGIERTLGGRLWACWVAGGDSPEVFFVLAASDHDGETYLSYWRGPFQRRLPEPPTNRSRSLSTPGSPTWSAMVTPRTG